MLKTLRLLFPLVLAGCAVLAPDPEDIPGLPGYGPLSTQVELHADTAFTPQEREQLELAAQLWQAQTAGVAQISIIWDLEPKSFVSTADHYFRGHSTVYRLTEKQVEEDDENTLAWVEPRGGLHNPWKVPLRIKFVMDRINMPGEPGPQLKQVALHEFGHVLGLPHSPAVYAIMYPAIIHTDNICLKQTDLSSFCSINPCGSVVMQPCED